MNTKLPLEIQAWVDGELADAHAQRVARAIEQDPEARRLAENLRAFGRTLRDHEPVRPVPETRDFYWSRIRQGIEQAERTAERGPSRPAPAPAFHPLRWLAWLLPAGAAALAAVFLIHPADPFGQQLSPHLPATGSTPLVNHEVETPSTEISSLTFYAAEQGMTIVWLGRVDVL